MENLDQTKPNKSIFKKISIIIAIFLLMLASFGAGVLAYNKSEYVSNISDKEKEFIGKVTGKYTNAKQFDQNIDFNLFWDVWNLLEKDYVKNDKLNEKELFYGSIKGMVAAAGDPYTIFMDPKESQSFANDLSGTFEGIGAEIGTKKDNLVVIAPLPDSPAEKAGLRSGDKIMAIDKISSLGMTVDEAVNKIRGKKGTTVTLKILRNGDEKTKEISINRDVIVVKSVKSKMRDDKIYVLTITNFNNDTEYLFNEAVEEIVKSNPKGLILDLRNNPGGYLDTAVKVGSKWINEGIIVSEKSTEQKKDYLAEGPATLKNIPTVVLVNQGSASASEIVAGALQDHKKATLIGMQTFGKGSVQIIENLKDGSSLKVTIAQWLTPNGNNINEKGITPDKKVDLTAKDYESNKDPQMDAAVQFLKTGKK